MSITNSKTTVIPAEPRWSALTPDDLGDRGFFTKLVSMPILAWEITIGMDGDGQIDRSVRPITFEYLDDSLYAVQRPDGVFVLDSQRVCETENEVLAALQTRATCYRKLMKQGVRQ